MSFFNIRDLARYFAASQMARSSSSSSKPEPDEVAVGVSTWNKNMRWLIPFVQASGYRIVIENPKSHEKIVIDKDTKKFPRLTSSWLRRYNKQELAAWMAMEKEKKYTRRIAESRGRAKFGDSYKLED